MERTLCGERSRPFPRLRLGRQIVAAAFLVLATAARECWSQSAPHPASALRRAVENINTEIGAAGGARIQGGAMAVRVLDAADNAPVVGASVTLRLPESVADPRTVMTDAGGQARFKSSRPGLYRLDVRMDGYEAASRWVLAVGLEKDETPIVVTVDLVQEAERIRILPASSRRGATGR